MQQFYSDVPEGPNDQDDADALLCDILAQWQDSGRSPAALLNAMETLVNDIKEAVVQSVEVVH